MIVMPHVFGNYAFVYSLSFCLRYNITLFVDELSRVLKIKGNAPL